MDRALREALNRGHVFVTLSRESLGNLRSSGQNRLMWPLLTDFSNQVTHLDGKKYKPDDWKDILTAGFEECMRYAPNLNGTGMIAFGARTSRYSKKKMSQFIEFIYAEGCERGVIWSNAAQQSYEEVAQQHG
jgi:hypothetical protein